MRFGKSSSALAFLFEHDLFRPAFARRSIEQNDKPMSGLRAGGKPVPAFRDHALELRIGLADLAADTSEAFFGGLVLVVDIEGLGVRAGGLVFLSQPFIGQTTAGPGSQIRGL